MLPLIDQERMPDKKAECPPPDGDQCPDGLAPDWVRHRLLGAGACGHVYLVSRDTNLAAMKVINQGRFALVTSRSDSHRRIEDEGTIHASLHHPNIVPLLAQEINDKAACLFMPLISGGNLLEAVFREGRLTEDNARRTARAIAKALEYIHCMHVLHRDVKPENVLLTSQSAAEWTPLLADFGLARVIPHDAAGMTYTGTPTYMAPEILRLRPVASGAKPIRGPYSASVDVWAFGVLVYIVLSGEPPFDLESWMQKVPLAEYEFDSPVWEDVDSRAISLVRAMIVVEPGARISTRQLLESAWLLDCEGRSRSRSPQ